MITECNTEEEYKKRISELRKERDNLRRRANDIEKEMDALELNSKFVDFTIGKYVIIDSTPRGGYKTYFHVNTWKKEPRGVRLYGKGFSVGVKYSLHLNETETLYWEHFDNPIEITEEEFFGAFEKEVSSIREGLKDFKNYKELPDGFKMKNSLLNNQLKNVFKSDSLTESLISKAANLTEQDEIS